MMKTGEEPKGCLAAILGILGINLAPPEQTGDLPYRLRDDFLSPAEFSFYRVLATAVGGQAVVCPKVNLSDIFFVARPNENRAYRNKIDRKHVDFLLCHPHTMKPLAGVELDDSTHRRTDRRERDEFVDQVYAAAGLPLVHFPAQATYEVAAVANALTSHLETDASVPPAIVAADTTNSPDCPKCGVPMVRRTATKGANQGKQFWGCPNYPKCRQVIS